MRRISVVLLLAMLGALGLAACGESDQAPTALESSQQPMLMKLDEPTPQDEEFKDELKAGTFTICKVVASSDKFDFSILAEGPGVGDAPLYLTEVSLGDGQCADVYTAPGGADIDPDLVTITELLPEGWDVDRVAIWSRDEQPDGSFLDTFHTMPAGTTTVQGSIDANKIGCVVIFYNSQKKEEGECTRTPGYWKTHPDAWPVETITIGGIEYTKAEAIDILWIPERGDKTKTLFRALVAAKLNDFAGTDVSCVSSEMADAEDWMAAHPVCSGVHGSDDAWRDGEPLYTTLDDYNNGRLCAPHCEDGDGSDESRGRMATEQ